LAVQSTHELGENRRGERQPVEAAATLWPAMVEPSDHVIIGDLPADLDEQGLKSNFEAYGTIKWCKLWDGKGSKGGKKSAMIEFASVEEATWLVENLNGNVPLGLETPVSVKFKSKSGGGGGKNRSSPYGGGGGCGVVPPGMAGKGGMGKGVMLGMTGEACSINDVWKGLLRSKVLPGGSWANDERTVVVSGLPSDTTEFDLLKIFSPFGAILPGGVRVKLKDDGTAQGSGMVNFADLETAVTATETLNNCMMPDGRTLRVRQFTDQGGGKGKGKGKAQSEE